MIVEHPTREDPLPLSEILRSDSWLAQKEDWIAAIAVLAFLLLIALAF